ncbi:hypothetical protein HanRHA438_Chr03g0122171 [Helianthus annuus]|nr:hypothetical protein HanRHA438_Chr03g0122171 [Helianthus annuus]
MKTVGLHSFVSIMLAVCWMHSRIVVCRIHWLLGYWLKQGLVVRVLEFMLQSLQTFLKVVVFLAREKAVELEGFSHLLAISNWSEQVEGSTVFALKNILLNMPHRKRLIRCTRLKAGRGSGTSICPSWSLFNNTISSHYGLKGCLSRRFSAYQMMQLGFNQLVDQHQMMQLGFNQLQHGKPLSRAERHELVKRHVSSNGRLILVRYNY